MRRLLAYMLAFILLLNIVPAACASSDPTLDPSVGIAIEGVVCQPTDAEGNPVYPILYEGTTYVPVRGLSYLFGKAVSWDGKTRTVMLSDEPITAPALKPSGNPKGKVLPGVRPDKNIKIHYNGEFRQFTNSDGKAVYPIAYNGTTYIPIRGVASLFGKTVGWDGVRRMVLINSPAANVKGVRIVVDGKVRTLDAKLYGGDWYLAPSDIKAVLGVDTAATLDGYACLRDVAKKANVSYEHDGVLNAAYIWTEEPYSVGESGDYNHAVSLGLISDDLKSNPDRQITANEYRSMLSTMVGRLEPGKVAWFEKNVTSFNKPLLRGEGFVMAYYAAVCVGADTQNNGFDSSKTDGGDFWSTAPYQLDALFPNIWQGPVKFSNADSEWHDYFAAAFLWSFWHSSPTSGDQVFTYDMASRSMRQNKPLTVMEAACAAARIYDSYFLPPNYLPVTDEKAVLLDRTIVSDRLLSKASALPVLTKENMPAWKGFVLSRGGGYENTDIPASEKDLREIANWGFNSVRIMMTYGTLFDEKAQTVNMTNLKKLDELVAAAIKYNLHIDLLTFSLPGRWTRTDFDTYKTIGSLDLFTNPERQREANAVWALLSERYKDIPSATLSFCPLWEAMNYSLSSGLPVPPYTEYDVARVYTQLIDTIRKHDPDRFVIFEPTANNRFEDIIKESDVIKGAVHGKYPDALMMVNFCEQPFVYAEMTAVSGAHVDHQNHSMFKPAYPTKIYAAQYHLGPGATLDMDGTLVAGTKIDIYLSRVDGAGSFEITADGHLLYSEILSGQNFKTDSSLSRWYPYAKSDKLISVTLTSDVKRLSIGYSGNWFEWSGIDVTLPAKYAVNRWWFTSRYDAMQNGLDRADPTLKETSTVMLCPNSYDKGRQITIHSDVTYTSSDIWARSDQETIGNWAKQMSAYWPKLIVRFESAGFCLGCSHDSEMKYYDDMLTEFDKYGFGWYSNDHWSITGGGHFYAGAYPVAYKDHELDVPMLKLLQKHQ